MYMCMYRERERDNYIKLERDNGHTEFVDNGARAKTACGRARGILAGT